MPTFESARSGLLWDATAVPNAFFCDYMPSAPESHVKVYLYGLMWARSGVADEEGLVAETARVLGLDMEQVERALRYWERLRLVERISDNPPRYRFASVQQVMMDRRHAPQDDAYESFAQAVYAAFGDRRKLHGGETVLAYEWVEQLRLPPEVVLMLIQHMISSRGVNFSFKEAQKVAVDLSEKHVMTLEAAEAEFSRSEAATKGARKILSHLGKRRNPSADEIDLYIKWTQDWGFDPEAILEACKETTKGAPTFAYLDKVLEGIRSRSAGEAITQAQVTRSLQEDQAETAQVRQMLQTLGISMAVIDEGMRMEYRDLCAMGGHELAMLAAREVVLHGKVHTLDRVKQLLAAWTQKGLSTTQAVNAYLGEVEELNRRIRALMDAAGAQGGCTQANRALLKQWQSDWRMSDALIGLAAEYARGTAKPMQYMHKLLSSWHEENIAGVDEARAAHEKHIAPKPASAAPAAPGKRVIEQQYSQRDYDPDEYDAIDEELLKEARKQ